VASSYAANPEELVRKSLANFHQNRERALHYTCMQRDEENPGSEKKVSVSRVIIVNGTPYERTISRDGKQLTGDQEKREEEKLAKRRNESGEEQQKRVREYKTAMSFLDEVPEAFHFRLVGEENIDGRPNYVVACTPKPGYHPHNSRAAMFQHIQAKLWIDKEDLQWTLAKADVIDTISIGWILARVSRGAQISIEQTRINHSDWLPKVIDVKGEARVMLVKDRPIREHITYYDYKPLGTKETAEVSKLKQ
jgi:hypothetical protein